MDAIQRRRWYGGVALVTALAMLLLGETALKGQLRDVVFIIYWSLCFGFTAIAIVLAFLDLRGLQRRTRDAQRDLMQTTLTNIETETKKKRSE